MIFATSFVAGCSHAHSYRIARLGATFVLLLTLLGSTAQAQTRTWVGGGANNSWSTSNNWSDNNVPDATGEAALFTDDLVGQTKPTPNLPADVTIGQLQFSAAAPSYTITGSGPSTLFLSPTASFGGVGITVASGAADQTISAAEVEFLSSQSWDIGGTTTLLVSGTIEDDSVIDYGLTKNGTGTLVFPGDVRYDGATTVNAGALVLSFSNTSMLSAITVNAGLLRATTSANALGSSSTRNTVTLAGGALELANDTGLAFGHANRNTIVSGNTTIRSDRMTAGAGVTHAMGRLSIGAQTLSVAAGAFVNSGMAGMTFGTTTLSANGAVFDAASGANLTLGALGGNFAFTKQGSGQLTLNTAANANRTSAGVTLSSGTMKLGNASALGAAAVSLTLNGGTLDLAINGSVNAHNTTVGGNATLASDRSTAGSGVTHTLGTLGIGAQILTVTAGTSVTSGTAGITFGATTLSGNATFDVVNSGSANTELTLGAIGQSGGVQSLTKTGNGTLALTAINSYEGSTTVQAGKLSLTNIGLADSADVFLSTGSTLELNFSGTADIIDSLFIDGVSQPVGTWGAVGFGAQHTSSLITGPGWLQTSTFVLAGDFDLDGDIDPDDVDLLAAHGGSNDPIDLFVYDVNQDGVVDFHASGTGIIASDSDYLIRVIKGTEYGDANLDGEVGLIDLDLLGQGFNGSGTGWFFGDFDGSGGPTGLVDLDLLGQFYGFVASGLAGVRAVPEPPASMLLIATATFLPLGRRKGTLYFFNKVECPEWHVVLCKLLHQKG